MGFFDLIKLILRLWDELNSIVAHFKKLDAENWDKKIAEGVKAYVKLQSAKTPEEIKDAQKSIADNWFNR